jgi:hypothetical protein
MALTDATDPGLLVLPTHRVVSPPSSPSDALARIGRFFDVAEVSGDGDRLDALLDRLHAAETARRRAAPWASCRCDASADAPRPRGIER